MRITPLLVSLFTFTFALAAQADKKGFDHFQFESSMQQSQKAQPSISVQRIYDISQPNLKPNQNLFGAFEKIANEQAQIWGDTILEGEFEADGATRIDRIEAIQMGAQILAYRVTYSEGAWSLSGCQYDFKNKALLKACKAGRITEASYVSAGLGSWSRDESAYAEFH
jgi:hypothetical protein